MTSIFVTAVPIMIEFFLLQTDAPSGPNTIIASKSFIRIDSGNIFCPFDQLCSKIKTFFLLQNNSLAYKHICVYRKMASDIRSNFCGLNGLFGANLSK